MHEIRLYFRRKTDIFNALVFFFLSMLLFPFGIGPEPEFLREVGIGIIWVAAIFSAMLGIPRIFEPDYNDGTLNQYRLLPYSVEIIVLAKIFANWAAFCWPLIILTPIAGHLFGLTLKESSQVAFALTLATPTFIMIGAVGSSLSLGSKTGRVMLALLVTPLYIPVLIFGVNAADALMVNHLTILAGLFLFFLPLSATACGFAIKEN
jgi:heme exporter protein B